MRGARRRKGRGSGVEGRGERGGGGSFPRASSLVPWASARRGFSYIELCVAMLILSLCIVPAARILPALLASQRGLETQYQLSLVAQEKLEAAVLALGEHFIASYDHGSLATQGHPTWHYEVLVVIPLSSLGRYATVRAQAWVDVDGGLDLLPDPEDPQVRFDTIVANRGWSP